MERPATTPLRIGTWCVNPTSGQISRDGETAQLEGRTLRLLLCLAEHAGEVVSIDDLLNQVWTGVTVSPDSVYQAVASLRRQLGDDSKQPTYIATVPRLGYRMVAAVSPWVDSPNGVDSSNAPKPRPRRKFAYTWAAGAVLCVAVIVGLVIYTEGPASPRAEAPPQKSIAVLPFLDLTDKMSHEIFANT